MSSQNSPDDAGSTPQEVTRRSFLSKGGLLAGAGSLAVQMAWPERADAQGFGDGQTRLNFRDIRRHENEHVDYLVNAIVELGGTPHAKPTFQNLLQPNRREFFHVSQALENTGVGAYLGAAPAIDTPAILAAAGSIALIEGRHAGWLNTLVNDRLTANVYGEEQSFETPLTFGEVIKLASPFIANPNGEIVEYAPTRSGLANDLIILNFALVLEYLEAEFYNLNVPEYIR